MNRNERQLYVSKIVTGITFVNFKGVEYIIGPPSQLDYQISERIYQRTLEEAKSAGVLSSEDFVDKLIDMELWSKDDEEKLQITPKKIEEIKVLLYNNYIRFRNNDKIRKMLKEIREEESKLESKKNLLRKESAEGIAEIRKHKYLICSNVTHNSGEKAWEPHEYDKQDSQLTRFILDSYLNSRVPETTIRKLSRTDPWTSFWSVGKSENGVFGKPSSLLTEEQRSIISWSRIYDSIQESPESPPDKVIEDDDMLDGWLIVQSKKRESDKQKGQADKAGMDKDEVYLFSEDKEGASRIYGMNDAGSRSVIRTRQKQIQKVNKVSAEETLDARLEIQQQAIEKFKGVAKG